MLLQRIVAGWIVLAVALTSATQLRPGGEMAMPVGPGELLLVGWMGFIAFLLLRGVPFAYSHVPRVLAGYWVAAGILLGFGTLMALASSRFNTETAVHDALALSFAAALSCLVSIPLLEGRYGGYHTRLACLMFFTMTLCTTALLAVAAVLPNLGGIGFWWAYRFRGWAENPNQMALLTLGMPFLGWHLLRRSQRFWPRVAYALAIGCCILVGLATYSDGLRVAWAAAVCSVSFLVWYRAVVRARGAVMYLSHLVVPIMVVALGWAFGDDLVDRTEQAWQAMYEEGDQGSTRISLWMNGIAVIARSPLVGFGPGPHSGLFGPFEGKEAHNMFIDWGTSAGVLGVLLHLGLLAWGGWRAIRVNSPALLGLVIALIVFGMFAYTLRQPIYWLVLVLALTLTERRAGATATPAPQQPVPDRYVPPQPPFPPGEGPRATAGGLVGRRA